jgi:hypothetical protein
MPLFINISSYNNSPIDLIKKVNSQIKRKNRNLKQLKSIFYKTPKEVLRDIYKCIKVKNENLLKVARIINLGKKSGKTIDSTTRTFANFNATTISNLKKSIYKHSTKLEQAKPLSFKETKSEYSSRSSKKSVSLKKIKTRTQSTRRSTKKLQKTKLTRTEKLSFPAPGAENSVIQGFYGERPLEVPHSVNANLRGAEALLLRQNNPLLKTRAFPQGVNLHERGNRGPVFEYDLKQSNPAVNGLYALHGRNETLDLRHHSLFGHYENDDYKMAKMRCNLEAKNSNVLPSDLKSELIKKGINLEEARINFRIWEPPVKRNKERFNRLNVITHSFAEKESSYIDNATGNIIDPNQSGKVNLGIFGAKNMPKPSRTSSASSAAFGEMKDVDYSVHLNSGTIKSSSNNAQIKIDDPNQSASCWMVIKKGNRWEVTYNHFLSKDEAIEFDAVFKGPGTREKTANVGRLIKSLSSKSKLKEIVSSMTPFLSDMSAPRVSV